jgi:hypothetical protein
MSANTRPICRSSMALLGMLLALTVLLGGCNQKATTSGPPATIAFLVRNATHTTGSYRFMGSATPTDLTGPLNACAETTIGTTWDPSWTFEVSGKKVVASSDSADLQPGANARDGLTVIVIIDSGGVRAAEVHPGAPDAGDTDAPGACD